MKYTNISTFTVLTIVASTLLAIGLVGAISTANEADAAANSILSNNLQLGGIGGTGGIGGFPGFPGGSNTVVTSQTIVCQNGICVTTTN
jgi:hypothetical protein